MALLEVKDLSIAFGHTQALTQVSLDVPEHAVSVVLGANGAGKSTLLKALAGAVAPRTGSIVMGGQDITHTSASRRVQEGLVLVPEGRRILVSMTVEENLLLGAHQRRDGEQVRREVRAIYDRFPNLAQRRSMAASCLSGGEQQMLAIGRAMLAQPRIMMLDEPSLGLSPLFVENMFSLLTELNTEQGLTVLLVEQNIFQAMQIAKWATVLELGKVVMKGPAAELLQDPKLQEAYLG